MGPLGWEQRLDGRPDFVGDQLLGHGWCRHGRTSSQTTHHVVKQPLSL
jgi:hypothetical protein